MFFKWNTCHGSTTHKIYEGSFVNSAITCSVHIFLYKRSSNTSIQADTPYLSIKYCPFNYNSYWRLYFALSNYVERLSVWRLDYICLNAFSCMQNQSIRKSRKKSDYFAGYVSKQGTSLLFQWFCSYIHFTKIITVPVKATISV